MTNACMLSREVVLKSLPEFLHAGGPFNPWVKPFGSLDQADFKCMAQEQGKCVSSPLHQ
jgi:hypothetical protein